MLQSQQADMAAAASSAMTSGSGTSAPMPALFRLAGAGRKPPVFPAGSHGCCVCQSEACWRRSLQQDLKTSCTACQTPKPALPGRPAPSAGGHGCCVRSSEVPPAAPLQPHRQRARVAGGGSAHLGNNAAGPGAAVHKNAAHCQPWLRH